MGSNQEPPVLITELEVKLRVHQLAREIAQRLQSYQKLTLAAVLKGGFIFASDLIRQLSTSGIKPRIDFLKASSYGDHMTSSGRVTIELDTTPPHLNGWNVLLVDDIIDTGLTLHYLHQHLLRKEPQSIITCVLLDKPSRRIVDFSPDLIGFTIPEHFVVGYGLDFAEEYRYLPYIGFIPSSQTSPVLIR